MYSCDQLRIWNHGVSFNDLCTCPATMLKTTRSEETMLADPYCAFSVAELFHEAPAASEYHVSSLWSARCPV